MITLWEADQSTPEWYNALGKALRDIVDGLQSFALFVGLFPQLSLASHLYDALGSLAAFWEKFRNDDDLVLTRGLAFGTPALSAIYDSPNRGTSWTFDASSEGMGRFELHVRYTGEEPVLPVGESKLLSGRPMLSGAGFDVGLDAVCNVPAVPATCTSSRASHTCATTHPRARSPAVLKTSALTGRIWPAPRSL